jgi:L-arabinokinase
VPSTVVFFISGHGFGHASRQVEIIHALAARRPDLRIIVRSAVNPALLRRTLVVPFELRPGPCDTGIVQTSSIEQDDAATVQDAIRFYRDYDARIDAEARAVAADRVALVVGDIAPLSFEVAARLNVPGVAIANFTWDWIYETHPGLAAAAPWIVPALRESYRQASLALELPFAGGFEVFPAAKPLPLVARRPTRFRADTRAHFGIGASRATVLLSFGGYGLPQLDLSALDCLGEWTVVTTDRVAAPTGDLPVHVRLIPEDAFLSSGFRYEDLVAAVDVVLTKPGYGIIAECISTGTAMLYTSRGAFREYAVLTRELPRYVRSRFISQGDLLAGKWADALHALQAQPPAREAMASDGAEHAAQALTDVLGASTSG